MADCIAAIVGVFCFPRGGAKWTTTRNTPQNGVNNFKTTTSPIGYIAATVMAAQAATRNLMVWRCLPTIHSGVAIIRHLMTTVDASLSARETRPGSSVSAVTPARQYPHGVTYHHDGLAAFRDRSI